MLRFAANIVLPLGMTQLSKAMVDDARPNKQAITRAEGSEATVVGEFAIDIIAKAPDGTPFPIKQTVTIRNGPAPSYVLVVNENPSTFFDQLQVVKAVLSNTAFTTLFNAWHANTPTGTCEERERALEPLLVALGAVPASFAGT